MKTVNRRLESQCQPRRLLLRALLSSLALGVLPLTLIIYDGSCLGPAMTRGCGLRHWDGWAGKHHLKQDEQRNHRMHVPHSVFQGLMQINLLKPGDKALCIGLGGGQQEALALKESGVSDAIGLDLADGMGTFQEHSFPDDTFDFEFSNAGDLALFPSSIVQELERTLKPGGVAVIRRLSQQDDSATALKQDVVSIVDLLKQSSVVHTRQVEDSSFEIGFKKHMLVDLDPLTDGRSKGYCVVTNETRSAIKSAEPLIAQEPLKPWIIFKENSKSTVYLPTVADLRNYSRHVYIDIGARNYGSSIGKWFKNQYPKQGHVFELFAIEADKSFQGGYASHSDVHFLPYAAWIRNESLRFGTNKHERGGMGRIQGIKDEVAKRNLPTSKQQEDNHIQVQGFDIADWMQKMLSPDDYVVVKMDIEGTEFTLLPHLFATGAICLIDELFLECHYNRWQRCCPERTNKFGRTYNECFHLFKALRDNGVLVHQWW